MSISIFQAAANAESNKLLVALINNEKEWLFQIPQWKQHTFKGKYVPNLKFIL